MKKLGSMIVVITLLIMYWAVAPYIKQNTDTTTPIVPANIIISAQREKHILYGDETGGGHMYGVGKPCKSEFPADWDSYKIINTTRRIAANDNLNWRKEHNGYQVTEQMIQGVRVRVVLGPDQKSVITAYPINLERNPCPANDR